jgi:Tol biopolymer transport system component/DNA-binding winged helix-turn-helix (wHTH) protein
VKNSEERLTFGEFTLDLRRHALFHGQERVHLTPKPIETLIYLVEHRGHVLTKEQLLDAVWKDTAVTDGVLVQAVREIRRALHDDKENPQFVQTVPREGYRFVGDVAVEMAIEPPVADTIERSAAESIRTAPAAVRGRFQLVAAGSAVLLAVVVWRLWTAAADSSANPSADRSEAPPRIAPLTVASISAVKPMFSPDGRAFLYVSDAPESRGMLELFLMPLGGGDPWRLTHMANAAGDMPVFTPDGREIVFSRYRSGTDGSRIPDLWKVSSFGGTVVRYISEASGAGFSPDGAWVAYTRHVGGARTLMLGPSNRIEDAREVSTPGYTPRWSPDGRWIAYTTSYPEGGAGDLWIVSSSLVERRQLTHQPHQMYGLAWSADSGSIVFASQVGNAHHLRRVSLSDGSIESLTSGLGDYVSPTVSADGRQLAFTQLRPVSDLVLAHPPDAGETSPVTVNEFHRWPRLSPSGRFVASVAQRSTADDYLNVTNVETRETRLLSDMPAQYPSWIDEDLVAYVTYDQPGSAQIRRVSLTSGQNSTLTRLPSPVTWLAVRPGGSDVAYVAGSGHHQRIVFRNLSSGHESVLAEGAEFEALRWRMDGELLAWSGPRISGDARTNGVYVVAPGRSAPERIVADGYGPVWNAEGAMFFVRYLGDRKDAGIWRRDPTSGVASLVRHVARIDYFDVAGNSLVYAVATGRSQVFVMPLR